LFSYWLTANLLILLKNMKFRPKMHRIGGIFCAKKNSPPRLAQQAQWALARGGDGMVLSPGNEIPIESHEMSMRWTRELIGKLGRD
jgi:hypothetical protein